MPIKKLDRFSDIVWFSYSEGYCSGYRDKHGLWRVHQGLKNVSEGELIIRFEDDFADFLGEYTSYETLSSPYSGSNYGLPEEVRVLSFNGADECFLDGEFTINFHIGNDQSSALTYTNVIRIGHKDWDTPSEEPRYVFNYFESYEIFDSLCEIALQKFIGEIKK